MNQVGGIPGNLPVDREKREIWASKTGHWTIKNPKASLQTDGNLVVYDGNGSSKWTSNTRCANAVLTMQDDGNVVMTADGKQIWATGSQQRMTEKPKRTDSIFAGDSLQAGQKINSANGKYYLEVTTDCVKVCKQDGSELWSAGRTAGNSAANLTFRSDGELQLLTRHDYVRWGSGTAGKGNVESCCIIQDDGNFVLMTDGKMIWHTNTRREADGSIRKTDRLPSGETIGKEGRLTSPNGKCEFVFQGDGNFVLYADGKPTWSSKTNWEAKGVVLRDDDNLVITGTNWHSGTRRRLNGGTAELILSDDGKAILKSENIVIWSTDPTLVRPSPPKVTAVQSGVAKLNPGEYLAVNQSLISPNDQFMATLQPDGNFVLFYKPVYLPLWRTNTAPNSVVTKLVMQYDSNLALLGAADAPVWTSKTDSRDGNASLYLQNDGNLVVSGGEKNWSSNIQLPALRGQVNQLNPGDSLLYFQSLTSKNGQYNLKFDNNGKISITKDGQSTYYTTAGNLSDAKFLTFNASYEEYRTTSPKLTLRNGSGQDIWTAAARESDVGRVERAREARNNKERREAEDQGRTHRDYYRRPTYDPPRFTLQDDGDAIIWFENDTVWSLKSLAKA